MNRMRQKAVSAGLKGVHWEKARTEYGVAYFPNVTMGWDPTPRCNINSEWANVGYPFMNTICNNPPENFRKALQLTKEKLLADPNGPRILNINCWNECTEGSYLEPDVVNGMSYLEAVKLLHLKTATTNTPAPLFSEDMRVRPALPVK